MVPVGGYDAQTAGGMEKVLYEFPDGYQQAFGEERFRFTEMLGNPKQYFDQVSGVDPMGGGITPAQRQ
jgi:actin-like protein 6A